MSGIDEGVKTMVIDLGSGYTKMGLADIEPTNKVIPSLVATDKDGNKMYGYEAVSNRKLASLSLLGDREFIDKWDDAHEFLFDAYRRKFKTDPNSHAVYVGVHNTTKKGYKEKLLQVFLEELRCPGFHMSPTSLLSLYGSGKLVGAILDVGHGTTTISASYEGLLNEHQEYSVKLGGRDVEDAIKKALNNNIEDPEFIRNIKHNKCKVSSETYLKKNPETNPPVQEINYTLPDGSTVCINSEVVNATEVLFKPSLLGKRCLGIHELAYDCINQSDYDARRELYGNVVLSGGSFHTPGLPEAVVNQLNSMIPNLFRVRLEDIDYHQSLPWMGGSIVSSMSTFQSNWITKAQLDEHGPSIVLRKCL